MGGETTGFCCRLRPLRFRVYMVFFGGGGGGRVVVLGGRGLKA